MARLDIRGVSYNVATQGEGEPLVLLHGFTGSSESWADHVEVFAEHFQVVMPDLPGHGESDAPDDPARYRIEQCVEDLATLFDALAFERVHLLGYSMGGRVALYAAVTYPERIVSLALESASPGLEDDAERQARARADAQLADEIERDGLEAFVNRWEQQPLFRSQGQLPEDARARLRAQRLKNNPRGLANSLRGLSVGMQPSLWEWLRGLMTPTLLIAGQLDEQYVKIARRMGWQMPEAETAIISDAGHATHLEQPEAFRSAALAFLLHARASGDASAK